MFGRLKCKEGSRIFRQPQAMIESLEPRQLLSAAIESAISANSQASAAVTSVSTSVSGYTPAQIKKAYGFDQISFGNVAADGKGQTIAIVDAYNDPNILADLKVFDMQFGIADPPSLKIVNQAGGSALPATDSGWAGEIALDVEWAHAIAPGASILLVEARSDSTDDLMAGLKYARSAPGVSVVSMSWGGSEYFSWGGSESTTQTTYDQYFTTPSGHQGVTFVAAAGDGGTRSGVLWPASSPNVLSVGGTTLNLQSDGTYSSETAWSGTSGGYSQVESEPSYQQNVQSTGARSVADVSYDANPSTGFAVYDSLPDQGESGWQDVGGTSAGTPQWAALIAIADQGRVVTGLGTLSGASQTLPLLYALYSSSYASSFNDITSGGSGGYRFRWGGGGNSGSSASTGYDTLTGLGTPKAAAVVNALVGKAITSSGSTGSSGSTSSGSGSTGSGSSGSGSTSSGSGSSSATGGSDATTTGSTDVAITSQLPASPLVAMALSVSSVNFVAGEAGWMKLRLVNVDESKINGPASVTVYASSDSTLSTADAAASTVSIPRLTLASGASKVVKIRFTLPSDLAPGSYELIASVTADDTATAPANAVSPSAVSVSPGSVDLAVTYPGTSVLVHPGKGATAVITLENIGNLSAVGTVTLSLYASADQTLGSSDVLLATLPNVKVNIRPGRSLTLHVRFNAPDRAGGTYNLIASMDALTSPLDSNPSNDLTVIGTRS
jgi:subtilase family serine protease